jgi:hypothetical protein
MPNAEYMGTRSSNIYFITNQKFGQGIYNIHLIMFLTLHFISRIKDHLRKASSGSTSHGAPHSPLVVSARS